VLFVTSSGHLDGGAEACLAALAPRIREHGWRPVVVVPFDGALRTRLEADGVECHIVELGTFRSRKEMASVKAAVRGAQAPVAAIKLAQLIRTLRPTVMHTNTAVTVAGAVAAKLTGVPHVWHVREILEGVAWHAVRWPMVRLSDKIICISSPVADHVAAPTERTRRKVTVIHDGIDTELFQPAYKKAAKRRVVMAARITPIKGHELFLRACRQIVDEVPDCTFSIAGGALPVYAPLEAHLKALTAQLGLEQVLTWEGQLDQRRLRDLLAQAQVLVVPTLWPGEGGGLVVLEGMSMGLTVMATRLGGPTDLIREGKTGFLVDPEPRSVASAVSAALGNPALRDRLGKSARSRIMEEHTLEMHAARVAALYEGVA
jgi:glycosyltransferase involved in cell wall biosynthesis